MQELIVAFGSPLPSPSLSKYHVIDAVTVIVIGADVAKQPPLFVTLTVYVPAALAVYVAFVAEAVMLAVGIAFTVIAVPVEVAEQLLVLLTVTV